ncbi:hypothetical protein EDD85DRAFT_981219 [Armillaria nabsnona]|nr:hypothetical protein EDD85DRAFT_981219 [Armillaria nabsnona]
MPSPFKPSRGTASCIKLGTSLVTQYQPQTVDDSGGDHRLGVEAPDSCSRPSVKFQRMRDKQDTGVPRDGKGTGEVKRVALKDGSTLTFKRSGRISTPKELRRRCWVDGRVEGESVSTHEGPDIDDFWAIAGAQYFASYQLFTLQPSMNSEEGRDREDAFGRKCMGGMCFALELWWSSETDNVPVPVANKLPEQRIVDASINWEARFAAATMSLNLIHRQIFYAAYFRRNWLQTSNLSLTVQPRYWRSRCSRNQLRVFPVRTRCSGLRGYRSNQHYSMGQDADSAAIGDPGVGIWVPSSTVFPSLCWTGLKTSKRLGVSFDSADFIGKVYRVQLLWTTRWSQTFRMRECDQAARRQGITRSIRENLYWLKTGWRCLSVLG